MASVGLSVCLSLFNLILANTLYIPFNSFLSYSGPKIFSMLSMLIRPLLMQLLIFSVSLLFSCMRFLSIFLLYMGSFYSPLLVLLPLFSLLTQWICTVEALAPLLVMWSSPSFFATSRVVETFIPHASAHTILMLAFRNDISLSFPRVNLSCK